MDAMDRFGEALVQAGRHRRLGRWRLRAFSYPAGRTPAPVGSLRRLHVVLVALALVFATAAIALAASGVLSGAPVKPEVPLSPISGNGLPTGGAQSLALRVVDPDGGLPWGMRILHTTRGQTCAQVGRVYHGQLGELGLDSAFGDDGRFHLLPADVLPPGYGGASGQIECVQTGQTVIFEDTAADRSAERLLPEEFDQAPGKRGETPRKRDLRVLSYGLLGPHAVSVTYRTPSGLRTTHVSGSDGAFLIVEPAGYIARSSTFRGHPVAEVGGSFSGEASRRSVQVMLAVHAPSSAIISAVTFRFGARFCSQGSGSPVHRACPVRRATASRSWLTPTHSLHAPVHLTLLAQTHAACDAAFLKYPCYKGQIEFTAPYAVTSAVTDYEVEAIAKCKVGGRPETAWGLERDVERHEVIRTDSLGRFVFTPSCASSESFRVSYINQHGPSAASPHASVIIGEVSMSQAKLPDGASITSGKTHPPPG
jgi:hypothetical protein